MKNNKTSIPKLVSKGQNAFEITVIRYDVDAEGNDQKYVISVDNINGYNIFKTIAYRIREGRYPDSFKADFDYDLEMELMTFEGEDREEILHEIDNNSLTASELVMYKFGPMINIYTLMDFCDRCDASYDVTIGENV